MTQTDAVLRAMLELITDTGGPYDPAALFLGVGTAITPHGAATVLADITQATGAMATRQAVTPWGVAYKMMDGRWVTDGPPLTFRPADATEAQTLAVWFLASAATAGTLKAFGLITPSVPLPTGASAWTVVPRITVDPDGRWSAEVPWNG